MIGHRHIRHLASGLVEAARATIALPEAYEPARKPPRSSGGFVALMPSLAMVEMSR